MGERWGFTTFWKAACGENFARAGNTVLTGKAAFGSWTADGDWLLVEDMAAGRVPDLVDAIVSLGGRVEAVIPEPQSLEESFLKLLGET